MILVDTSVWIDHLRIGNSTLAGLLTRRAVLAHPCVTGELALGNLARRDEVLGLLDGLPLATVATDDEVRRLVDQQVLYGTGIGYVDAQLLASTLLTPGTALWINDKRLQAVTSRLGLGYAPAG